MKTGFWQKTWWQPPQYYGFKVIALVLALLVWGYVTVNQNPLTEGTYSVPVEIRNLSDDLAQPETNYQVQVRVQGTAGMIDDLTSYNIAAYVDLTDMTAGEATPAVNVDLPANVSLVSRSPESIQLTLEKKVSQSFAVEVKTSGVPADNYSVLEPVLSPEMITLAGSATHITEVNSVYVTADLEGLSGNYNKNLAVEVLNASGENITDYFSFAPVSVSLMIPVVFEQPESTLSVRGVTSGKPAEGYQLSRVVVEPGTVQAFGPLEILDALYYLETEPVNINGLTASTSFTARLVTPADVSLSRDTVTVVVQIEAVNTKLLSCALSEQRGLAEGLRAELGASACNVVVSGTDTYLDALSAGDVTLYVDLSQISAVGVYELPVQATVANGVTIMEIHPQNVTVTVTDVTGEEQPQAEEQL